jgi:hypothetical protein
MVFWLSLPEVKGHDHHYTIFYTNLSYQTEQRLNAFVSYGNTANGHSFSNPSPSST